MVMLDYSACGRNGEPTVIHVDQESDYKITYLAPDFASFINGLISEEEYDESEEELVETLKSLVSENFSHFAGVFCQRGKEFRQHFTKAADQTHAGKRSF
jgi:hypothetical protein